MNDEKDTREKLEADDMPEGDAPSEFAEILMALAADCSCMGDGIVRHFEPKDVQDDVDALMRVVERDYVSRETHSKAYETWQAASAEWRKRALNAEAERDEALEICDKALGDAATFKAERDELKAMNERLQVALDAVEGCDERCKQLEAERDELKSRHCPHYHVDRHYCDVHETRINELIAERDELQRKEKQLSNELGLHDKAIELLQDVKQELIAERDEWKAKAESKSAKRASAVENLKANSDWGWSDLADFFKASGLMDDPYHTPYRELRDALIDLLTDEGDCGQIADMSEKTADCVREGGEMSEVDRRDNGWYLRYDGYMTSKSNYLRISGFKADRALDNHQNLVFVKFMGGKEADCRVYAPKLDVCENLHDSSDETQKPKSKEFDFGNMSDSDGENLHVEHDSRERLNAFRARYGAGPTSMTDEQIEAMSEHYRPKKKADMVIVDEIEDEPDSREKLEADVLDYQSMWPLTDETPIDVTWGIVRGWLDRQAAITEREVGGTLLRQDERIAELLRQVDVLSERKCPGYEPENHYCRYHAQDFELNDRTVSRLKRENVSLASDLGECMAERGELKERIAELQDKVDDCKSAIHRLHSMVSIEPSDGSIENAREVEKAIEKLQRENAKLSAAELHYRSECEQLRGKLEAAEKRDMCAECY